MNSYIRNVMNNRPRRPSAFTLIEVVAGVFLLALMLATITVAFQRTSQAVIDKTFKERAAAVAQRRLELLLASRQEPNTLGLRGRDELDPVFRWDLDLSRETVGNDPPRDDLSNTVIKAVITVTSDPTTTTMPDLKMVRYFASLLPLPGHDIAVPLIPEQEEALWYIELRERLGREPTIEEALEEMVSILELPPETLTAEDMQDLQEDLEFLEDPNKTDEDSDTEEYE